MTFDTPESVRIRNETADDGRRVRPVGETSRPFERRQKLTYAVAKHTVGMDERDPRSEEYNVVCT